MRGDTPLLRGLGYMIDIISRCKSDLDAIIDFFISRNLARKIPLSPSYWSLYCGTKTETKGCLDTRVPAGDEGKA